ncbi:MAG: hydantoinase/oxoprolinase family protein [Acidimicrobiia bacterium]|nr:hydantoinase/oxoprolinase family protein [Acidimicrobiia bacterium]
MTNVFHVGVDVGGTFTDLVCVSDDGTMTATKVPNVGDDPSTDVCAGLDDLAGRLGVSREAFYEVIEVIVHGTTVATNAILTGRIARTGLITTLGFRDALEMRRGIRERLYDNKYTPPPPLVPRYLRLGVRERVDAGGRVVEPLDEDHLREAVARLRHEDVESVAVCFLHAYRNPVHEAQAAEVIAAEWPEVHVSLSHAVLSERRFYERISTTAINAAVGPILATYLRHLLAELGRRGFGGALRVMKSNGGLMSPEVAAAREAAHTLLSGPAGAVAGGTAFSRMQGNANLIVMDMGGTSCDVCLIEDGTSLVTREGSVARYRLMLPMLDIHTVGAGGGSIARVDEAGLLEVGPASAGSHPGPACYQRGGDFATVTDADVVLGYISPDYFLGGRMALDGELARQAVRAQVADALGTSDLEAAAGVYDVINAKMAAAIREVSVQRGYDPRRFTLLTAGGAGAVHVCPIARDIGIRRVMVPRDASVFSAFGMLTTDYRHDFVRTYEATLSVADPETIRAAYDEMCAEGEELLAAEGVEAAEMSHVLKMDLRYHGQIHEVEMPVEPAAIGEPDMPSIHEKFHERHEEIYSYATEADPVEVVNLRVTSIGHAWTTEPRAEPLGDADASAAFKGTRSTYFRDTGVVEVPVYDGTGVLGGMRIDGPCIVELPDTNVVVDTHFDLSCDNYGHFLLEAKDTAE